MTSHASIDANATSQTKLVEIYVDGACSGNPGPGGWGVAMIIDGKELLFSGGDKQTTNNRMELQAAISGLENTNPSMQIKIFTDSQYVKNGMTTWIHSWKKKNWISSKNEPVKNQDLWMKLDEVASSRQVEWNWVKGHSGHPMNEKVDMLAKKSIIAMQVN